jgi:hypothetical protein
VAARGNDRCRTQCLYLKCEHTAPGVEKAPPSKKRERGAQIHFNHHLGARAKTGVCGYWVMKVFTRLGTLSLAPLALTESTL